VPIVDLLEVFWILSVWEKESSFELECPEKRN